jgi:hypothetical protein
MAFEPDSFDRQRSPLPRRRPVVDNADEKSLFHPIISVLMHGSMLVFLGGGCVLVADAILSFLSAGAHKITWSIVGIMFCVWFPLGYVHQKLEELRILMETDDRIVPRDPIK